MHLINDFPVPSAKGVITVNSTTTIAAPPSSPLKTDILKGSVQTAEQRYINSTVSNVLESYTQLASLPSLEPSAIVDTIFGRLVKVAVQIPEDDVAGKILAHPDVVRIGPHLQELCSAGEYQLEKFWAKQIASAESEEQAKSRLAEFTYYENYVDLTRLELNAIASATGRDDPPPRRIAFLGSGPLPLTSLCLIDALQSSSPEPILVQNVDWNLDAISLASSMCRKLGIPEETMAFSCRDAAGRNDDGDDLKSFDVVYLAALVGRNDRDKKMLMRDVISRMRPGSLLVIRSAHSLRRLLYPAVNVSMDMIRIGFEPLVVVHPFDHVVNSVVVGRVSKQDLSVRILLAA